MFDRFCGNLEGSRLSCGLLLNACAFRSIIHHPPRGIISDEASEMGKRKSRWPRGRIDRGAVSGALKEADEQTGPCQVQGSHCLDHGRRVAKGCPTKRRLNPAGRAFRRAPRAPAQEPGT